MLIYAMDTSGPTAGVALVMDGAIRYEATAKNKMTHSESIMPLTEEAFLHAGLTLEQVDLFSVTVGPGSFTGVRIGVTAVKAMAHAMNKPIVGVDALEALARGISLFDGVLCPIQDARAGQVYGAAFEGGKLNRLLPDEPLKLEDYLKKVSVIAGERKLILSGDGVPVHRERISALIGERAVFAPPECLFLRPAAVACLAGEKPDTAVDYKTLKPLYLRAPQAERQRNLLENANHA